MKVAYGKNAVLWCLPSRSGRVLVPEIVRLVAPALVVRVSVALLEFGGRRRSCLVEETREGSGRVLAVEGGDVGGLGRGRTIVFGVALEEDVVRLAMRLNTANSYVFFFCMFFFSVSERRKRVKLSVILRDGKKEMKDRDIRLGAGFVRPSMSELMAQKSRQPARAYGVNDPVYSRQRQQS